MPRSCSNYGQGPTCGLRTSLLSPLACRSLTFTQQWAWCPFNLGAALHRLGRRVLLIDLDPQAALSVASGIPIGNLKGSIYDLLLDENLDPFPLIHTTVSELVFKVRTKPTQGMSAVRVRGVLSTS